MARACNKHHLFWPAAWYTSPLERRFRDLPCNIVNMQREVHELLHKGSEPPEKPTTKQMVKAVRQHQMGRCPCVIHDFELEKRRHEHHHERAA